MTVFDELLRDLVEPNVDRLYSEDFVLTPQVSTPNGKPRPDPARSPITGKGVFSNPTKAIGIQMGVRKTYREANDMRALAVGEEPYLSVDLRVFGGLVNEPRQGDLISLPERVEVSEYQVVAVERDGLTRLKMKLIQQGRRA